MQLRLLTVRSVHGQRTRTAAARLPRLNPTTRHPASGNRAGHKHPAAFTACRPRVDGIETYTETDPGDASQTQEDRRYRVLPPETTLFGADGRLIGALLEVLEEDRTPPACCNRGRSALRSEASGDARAGTGSRHRPL